MKIKLTVPAKDVDERTLGAALEAATEIAQRQVEQGAVPPLAVAIDAGVRWAPEGAAAGDESFDPPLTVIKRGWGDCDDLGPYWAGELRASGVDPDAKPIVYQSGPRRWHVVVERGDGKIDDPSRWAGMGGGRISGTRVPFVEPLGSGKTVVGFSRLRSGGVSARLDVPVVGLGEGVSVTRYGGDALHALHHATRAAGLLALWGAPDDVLARLFALSSALQGEPGDYADYGGFVQGIAAHIDAGKAADIATAFLDPLGIHNMIAPLAQQFVSSYAQGLAQKGSSKAAPAAEAKASGDPCPAGWHWESRGGIDVCVPDRSIDRTINGQDFMEGAGRGGAARGGGARGGARGGQQGGARGGGARGGQQGGRDAGAQQPDPNAPQYDPQTGLFFDPQRGMYIDPFSGAYLSADLQWDLDPDTGTYLGPSAFQQQQQPMYGQPQYGQPQYGAQPGFSPQQYAFGGGNAYGNPYG